VLTADSGVRLVTAVTLGLLVALASASLLRWTMRPVAEQRQDGPDVAEELVARGWALAFRRFSDAYVAAEERARLQRRGIWSGEFIEPEHFRSRR
jgi:endonuclease YncB( thermonuclease family)